MKIKMSMTVLNCGQQPQLPLHFVIAFFFYSKNVSSVTAAATTILNDDMN
jgi:hypothetical protein